MDFLKYDGLTVTGDNPYVFVRFEQVIAAARYSYTYKSLSG